MSIRVKSLGYKKMELYGHQLNMVMIQVGTNLKVMSELRDGAKFNMMIKSNLALSS